METMAGQLETTTLYVSRTATPELTAAVSDFVGRFSSLPKTCALLYAPNKCFLSVVNEEGKFLGAGGEIDASSVFEARVFNETAELRWLNEADGKGAAVVLCQSDKPDFFGANAKRFTPSGNELVGNIEQTYLLWGQSTGRMKVGWTQFATARLGEFPVPLEVERREKQDGYAQFTAVEYLGEYEDGNVAVCEERLTGIRAADTRPEAQNNGRNNQG